LAMAHEQGLVNLSAHFISVTDTLALAEATAEFSDGRTFRECADATPGNVGPTVRAHFPRIAATRAKARCLRDDLNISVASIDASRLLHTYLADVDGEHFVILMLDRKNRVLGIHTVSIGSLTASIVHPRETYKAAILANAAAIICGHNHASGDCQPSREDRAITQRLKEGGALLGINLLDHVIVGGEGRYFSFADENLL